MAEVGGGNKVKDESLGKPTARLSRKTYLEVAQEEEATEGSYPQFLSLLLYLGQDGTWRIEAPPKLQRAASLMNYSDLYFWSVKIWQIHTGKGGVERVNRGSQIKSLQVGLPLEPFLFPLSYYVFSQHIYSENRGLIVSPNDSQ